ncbi:MAG TPA: NAD-dependent epimerase/dehydratase family protein [Oligoflexia bacterium]|nr:NAD-dependent epimerase/dehydratase family protein [Oligoflexia bacterium]HMR23834.1 NAD-dependent epimerase/dehydratase family protein [Oligoflexia bacterium]
MFKKLNILIIGGNRFFGKKLAQILSKQGHRVTLLNRGNMHDNLGDAVKRIVCDRLDLPKMKQLTSGLQWDVVFDQVCFDYKTAKQSCEIFKQKVKKYIFISSQSVYDLASNLIEEDFVAKKHQIKSYKSKDQNYAEAKRQAEYAFEKYAEFQTVMVRFPIVLGNDDYTQRFQWHIRAVQTKKTIYFLNSRAKMSMISSDLAAEALNQLIFIDHQGPLNIASSKALALSDFMQLLAKELNVERPKLENTDNIVDKDVSPYAIEKDWYMNCEKMLGLGINLPEVKQWLPHMLEKSIKLS